MRSGRERRKRKVGKDVKRGQIFKDENKIAVVIIFIEIVSRRDGKMERDRKFLKEEKWSSGGGRGGDINRQSKRN